LVFLGSRSLDLSFLAARLEKALGARGFTLGTSEVVSPGHLKMGLGPFELHLTELRRSGKDTASDGVQRFELAHGTGSQDQGIADPAVTEATLTLTVTIVTLTPALPNLRASERTTVTAHAALALATLELAQVLDPDYVQWLQPDMMLQTTSFLSVLEKVTPRRISAAERARAAQEAGRRPPQSSPSAALPVALPVAQTQANRGTRLFPDIDDTWDRLESRSQAEAPAKGGLARAEERRNLSYLRALFRREDAAPAPAPAKWAGVVDSDEPSTALRLAAWMVALAVSVLSLPIGIALMVYHLLRGEDLRLALTALALTGTFTALVGLGLVERVMTSLSALPFIDTLVAGWPF
jgi:hypothetical protein